MTNRRYGKNISGTTIEYAPRTFRENGALIAPRIDDDEFYHNRGWFTIVDIKPSYDATTKLLSLTGWTEDNVQMTLTAQYDVVDRPAPTTQQVRRFSKLRLVEFCMEQGIWDELKAFLEETGYYDLFVMAVFFLENDKFFARGLQAFQQHKAQEEGHDSQALQEMIDQALAYAFDSYEVVDVEQEENQA